MAKEIVPVVRTLADSGMNYVPKVAINHTENKLEFNDVELTGFQKLNIIMLGAIRQRIMWSPTPGTIGILECESKDFEHGTPTVNFPWEDSNFARPKTDVPQTIQCGACMFSNWTADPNAKRGSRPARCTEQVMVPMLIPVHDVERIETTAIPYKVGVMSFQKSSIRPLSDHMKRFRLRGAPAYSKQTSMVLDSNLGSGFKYSVPRLSERNPVDEMYYPLLSTILHEVKAIVTKPTPIKTGTGGFLSVGSVEEPATGYTGTFFS